MTDFCYTTVPGKLAGLLDKIRSTGVPPKATAAWLKSLGFTSSNDSTLLKPLKFIDLCDQSGSPTNRWKQYRGGSHAQVLADAIRFGYQDLFALHPNAQDLSDTDLNHFFATHSSGGSQAVAKTSSTFKSLCAKPDFSTNSGTETANSEPESPSSTNQDAAATPSPNGAFVSNTIRPEIHIDIQIHISPEASTDQIDQIFSSTSKHLYGRSGHE